MGEEENIVEHDHQNMNDVVLYVKTGGSLG